MKKYVICIEETVSDEFEIFAESKEDAIEIAIEKYKNAEFVLEPGVLCFKQMAIVSPNECTTDWQEF